MACLEGLRAAVGGVCLVESAGKPYGVAALIARLPPAEEPPQPIWAILLTFLVLGPLFWFLAATPLKFAILVVFILAMLTETIGSRYPRVGRLLDSLSGGWYALAGWQRGVLGTFIVLAAWPAFFFFIYLIMAITSYLFH
jgi:hypothetical protein